MQGASLPFQGGRFIGREKESQEIANLLLRPEVRLLTLTGTGGVGKTRLALHVASTLRPTFSHNVHFISLAALNEPSLMIPVIAQTLGITGTDETSVAELLKVFCASHPTLLILDNLEHIVIEAQPLTTLLEGCPQLKLLATSRAVLRLSYEYEFPVAPLALPDLLSQAASEGLAHCASIALFIQRAQMVKPNFQLLPENGPAIAEICVQLDGLPLAIELAAAQVKLFTPQTLLTRLNRSLHLLTSREQDRPIRHQTLRANLDWSYQLLSAREQRLFRQLAVFVGGCTLQAIEGVYARSGVEDTWLLEDLTFLLEKSLISSSGQKNGELRFSLLQTIHEYAWECLEQSGETAAIQQAHADYYLNFMEQAQPELEGREQILWMDAIKQDYQNLRTSLTWFLKQKEEQRTGEQALRLAAALTPFWIANGILNEGCAFLEQALSDSETRNSSVRAKALTQLGHLLRLQIRLQSNFERPAATAVAQPEQRHPSPPTPGVIASRPPAPKDAALSAGLTRRETDVLRLVAKGLTDAQVAEQLVLSRRTVNWYLTVIYQKIGVSSRSAATRYALEQQLV